MNVDEYRALTERDLREPEPNPKVAAERLPEPNFHKQVMQDLDRMLLEPDPAQVREVAWVKEHAGLTWGQLGKVFGVSRRAIHLWSNGGRLNEPNARRLREFGALIRRLETDLGPAASPETVRGRLLEVESDGLSLVDRLRRQRSSGAAWGAPFGPEHLVGAIREPLPGQPDPAQVRLDHIRMDRHA